MARAATGVFAAGPVERGATIAGAAGALLHCTAMGFMGWLEPLGIAIDAPALRPLEGGPLGHAFILFAFALLTFGLRGRPRWLVGAVAGASLWLYISMYPFYIAWLHNLSVVAWIVVLLGAYWLVRVRPQGGRAGLLQ